MAQDTLEALTRPVEIPPPPASVSAEKPAPPPAPEEPKKPSELLEAKLDDMLSRYGPEHPDVKRLRADIARAKAVETRMQSAPRPFVSAGKVMPSDTPAQALAKAITANPLDVGQARERILVLKSQIVLAQKEIESRRAEQGRIERDIAELQGRLTNVPMREQEMQQITRDYDITRLNYHSLLEKQLSAEMSTDMERRQKSERFTIIDPAHVPERPSKPNRLFFGGVGSLFFFAMTVLSAIGLEMRKDNLLGEWELPENVPVLARVPYISMAGGIGFWAEWGTATRVIVISLALISVAALIAARMYLKLGF
jgi:hypothetical protein